MTRILFAAALGAAAVTGTAMAAGAGPDAVVGHWHSETKNGIVDIRKCGSSLCGSIVTGDDIKANPNLKDSQNKDESLRNRPLKGLQILSGFHEEGGDWVDGQVYKPDNGKTYSGKITIVDANHLKLRGCVFVPICLTQTWTRVQ
jgi:uncharacterized protein (DUF2147 family)